MKAVSKRIKFNSARQRDGLTALQEACERSPTDIASDLGMSDPNYRRYVAGRVPLRYDQFARFAGAYGVTVAELVRSIGLLDDEATAGWDMATALRSHVPQADIPGLVAEHGHKPLADQQAAARAIIRNVHEAQRKATTSANQSA